MADPRHHHYISECYLRGFAVLRKKGKHQLQVFDRVKRAHYPSAPHNVAGERDFNRLDEGQGDDPFALERAYAGFEGELAPAIQRVAEAAAFTSDNDRNLILNMVCLFALRNPRFREQMRTMHEDMAKRVMSLALATPERWAAHMGRAQQDGVNLNKEGVSYEDMKAFFDGGDFKINLNRGYQIGTELQTFGKLLPHLVDRQWWFVRAHRNSAGFVTGDHPVSLMWSDPKMRGGLYPPGFGLTGTQVTFPLTPRVAMLGAFEIKEQTDDIAEPFVAQINGTTIGFSERQIYARDLNFHYMLTRADGVKKGSRLVNDPNFIRQNRPARENENA